MKIRIKTAHGYLSFQPDGRLEYRNKVGIWEEIEIEGFTLDGDETPTPDKDPIPEMSENYVEAVKKQLESKGVNLSGPCGAFKIVKHVAWGLRSFGVGLLSKPGGNNCEGYSTDYLVLYNGDGIDILGDAGGLNNPTWQVKPGEFANQDRWRKPLEP